MTPANHNHQPTLHVMKTILVTLATAGALTFGVLAVAAPLDSAVVYAILSCTTLVGWGFHEYSRKPYLEIQGVRGPRAAPAVERQAAIQRAPNWRPALHRSHARRRTGLTPETSHLRLAISHVLRHGTRAGASARHGLA
jgi:hypothetical protein